MLYLNISGRCPEHIQQHLGERFSPLKTFANRQAAGYPLSAPRRSPVAFSRLFGGAGVVSRTRDVVEQGEFSVVNKGESGVVGQDEAAPDQAAW
jgi:hypothetical protein